MVMGDDLPALRDRALLLLGYAGAFRRSELVALDVEKLRRKRPRGARVFKGGR
jgi:site-specific recombinase XerC